jgi:hypothetical protein
LQSKAIAIENDLRGTLRNFGLKVGVVGTVKFEARIQELVENIPDLALLVEPLLIVRRALREQIVILHRRLLANVREDEVCRRLMTTPGWSALTGEDMIVNASTMVVAGLRIGVVLGAHRDLMLFADLFDRANRAVHELRDRGRRHRPRMAADRIDSVSLSRSSESSLRASLRFFCSNASLIRAISSGSIRRARP